jgi:hypothetical protein
MKYSDLIQFEPVESVVELERAKDFQEAQRLVSTYVISNDMAERLTSLIIPQLQYTRPNDNKGLLIVGNYGTGKSHLMAVLAAIAEHAELAATLANPRVRQSATEIAGKFKVIRAEIGATSMSLRDIFVKVLSEGLETFGVYFEFPPVNQVVNNKAPLEAMMQAFQASFPESGLLLVVDELLDYLRSRNDHELISDLSFLREVGEVCGDLRLRLLAGIQETLFENPRFAYVAQSLRRVKDRFEQILIARNDLKFVVAQRLLRKDPAQEAQIRQHLTKFAPYYGNMAERLDEFVRLFPVHPGYIDMFERIPTVEKRGVLKTLSLEMRKLLDQTVPTDQLGLLTYDHYWNVLKQDPSFKSIPDFKSVIDCSEVLENRIVQAFTRPAYRPMALKIIHGLSIHRLAHGDVYAQLGATPEELRDGLSLFEPLLAQIPSREPAVQLLNHVEVVLKEIHRTVSGQFITFNPANRQYFLDLKKADDYDALIERRTETLDNQQLDRYYYDALKRVLEYDTQATYVTGFKIWQHEVEWRERHAARLGYLFFGAPNERSTAQPPRDFYLYFLPLFQPTTFKDAKQRDEVFFRLTKADKTFNDNLRKFAAATDLATISSGQAQKTYSDKAETTLREMVKWLQEHIQIAFEVTYEGKTRPLQEWLKGKFSGGRNAAPNVRDIINATGSICLAPHFEDLAPNYPTFGVLITSANRVGAAQEALRWLQGRVKTQQGAAVLDALQLLEGDRLEVRSSPYANHILALLQSKNSGQVVNRNEIITRLYPDIEYLAPATFRLEPEWVAVLLAALVTSGELVLAVLGRKYDAGNLEVLLTAKIEDLLNFKQIEQPKGWQVPAIRALFTLLELQEWKIQTLVQGSSDEQNNVVRELQVALNKNIERLIQAQRKLATGFPIWNRQLLDSQTQKRYRDRLDAAKIFLENVRIYNSPALLKNFGYKETEDPSKIQALAANLHAVGEIEDLDRLVGEILPLAAYLSQAENLLLPGNDLPDQMRRVRTEALEGLENPSQRQTIHFRQQILQKLAELKKEYIVAYSESHYRARLGVNDGRKLELLKNDPRLKLLRQLSSINLLPKQQLKEFEMRLDTLQECSYVKGELKTSPFCENCYYRRVTDFTTPDTPSASQQLPELDERLNALLEQWQATLLENLREEGVQRSIALITNPSYKNLLLDFTRSGVLPTDLGQDFIRAVDEALSGLTTLPIKLADLTLALEQGGMPTTPQEFKRRFEEYLDRSMQMQGLEALRVRVVLIKDPNYSLED